MNIVDKFWSYVDKTEDCWIWKGTFDLQTQRCKFSFKCKPHHAHKFAWELFNPPLPYKGKLAHSCQNPRCVNPEHLYPICSDFGFWSRVNKLANEKGCWLWTGSKNDKGYGHHSFKGKVIAAHRFAWLITHGNIPDSLYVLHHCDERDCVNPEHLYLGTQFENMQDMVRRNRGKSFAGEQHSSSKLTEAQVKQIRAMASCGSTQVSLAKQFNVNRVTIAAIIKRETWKHI